MFPLRSDERTAFFTAAGILAAASIALLRLPLLNYLGYEFSAAVALLLPFVTGVYTMRALTRRWPAGASLTSQVFTESVRDLLVQNAALLLIPFAAALANGILVKNCSYGEGMLAYILLPIVTSLWLVALSTFCAALLGRPYRWYAGTIALVLVHPLFLGYFTPAVYSYNFVYGYFPGLTYDESLYLSWPLMLFRYLTFLAAALLLLVAEFAMSYAPVGSGFRGLWGTLKQLRFHRQGRTIILAVALQLALGWIFRVQLGFESTSTSIERALDGSVTTAHFDIHYAPESFTKEELRWVAAMHEFRYEQVRADLRVSSEPRIASFLYPDASVKRRFIGAGNTNIAKPWRSEIHLNADSWSVALKHELVHVIAGEFGMPVIRAHYNTGLVEGLATAVDDDFGNRSLNEYAAAMIRFGIVDQPSALIRFTGFASQTSSVSYVAMGSFCQFLLRVYGVDRFKEVYHGGAPEKTYGRSYDELLAAWEDSLRAINVPDAWRAHVEYVFRRPSIFAKTCARAVANLNEGGMERLARREPILALAEFHAAQELSWNSESFSGMVRSAFAAGRFDSVRQMMAEELGDSGAARYGGLLLSYGDACWLRRDTVTAGKMFRTVAALDLSEGTTESAVLRSLALEDSLLSSELPRIIVAPVGDSTFLAALNSLRLRSNNPVVGYISAKLALRSGRYADASTLLGTLMIPAGSVLEPGWNRMMGEAYFRQREWDHAAAHFRKLRDLAVSASDLARAEDDMARCAWFAAHEDLVRPE